MPEEVTDTLARVVLALPTLVAAVVYIYFIIGWPVFAGLGLMIGFTPLSLWFVKIQKGLVRHKKRYSDERLKHVNESLQGIKLIKLYAWEDALDAVIRQSRQHEMHALGKWVYYTAATIPLTVAIPSLSSVITFAVLLATSEASLSPADAFAVVALFTIVRTPFTTIPIGISMWSKAKISSDRFDSFYEIHNQQIAAGMRATFNQTLSQQDVEDSVVMRFKDAKFTWDPVEEEKPRTLDVGDLVLRQGALVGVVGPVGSGKSSFASALLGEMRCIQGDCSQREGQKIAYCSQEPFIMNDTLRGNVSFGQPLDEPRFQTAVRVSALLADIAILPNREDTEIGERGVNVSGGQKARISLARAVYAQTDMYVLDDPLSAVDAHVGRFIFTSLVEGHLKGQTRVLVTNDVHKLGNMDYIVVMKENKVDAHGTFEELQESGHLSSALAGMAFEEEEGVEGVDKEEEMDDQGVDKVDPLQQDRKQGNKGSSTNKSTPEETQALQKKKGTLTQKEAKEEGKVAFKVYLAYWLSGVNQSYLLLLLLALIFLSSEAAFLVIDTTLASFTQNPDANVSDFLVIYSVTTAVFVGIIFIRGMAYATFWVSAARSLHSQLLAVVLRYPMAFYWSQPLGRVLNRLSADTYIIDEVLTNIINWYIMTSVRVLGILILIIFASPYFAIFMVPLMLAYHGIKQFYRRTSREVQRLEAVTRSPILSHLSETLNGVPIIKSYGHAEEWISVADQRLELNHRARFVLQSTFVWLSQYLELLGSFIIFFASVSIVFAEVEAGYAGLAVAYSLNIVINLNMNVRFGVMVESLFNSVERVLEYSDIAKEEQLEPGQGEEALVAKDWPQRGKVEFKHVSLSYREDLDPALDGVDFSVQGGQSVGIVGRTGKERPF